MSHMNESCHTGDTVVGAVCVYVYICVCVCVCVSHVPCNTHIWAMLHIWMSHVTQVTLLLVLGEYPKDLHIEYRAGNESCHTYEWVMSHIWMSHVTFMNASCHTHELCHTHECVCVRIARICTMHNALLMSHVTQIWMSHVPHLNEPCHICEWAM